MEDYDIDRICRFLENIERNTNVLPSPKQIEMIVGDVREIKRNLESLNRTMDVVSHNLREIAKQIK